MLTRFTPEHIPVFRALLEIGIEIGIELRNTSSFLGLYSRSRSRSNFGTPYGSGSGRVIWGPMRGLEKNCMGRGHSTDRQTDTRTDMSTLWPTRPRGPSWWKSKRIFKLLDWFNSSHNSHRFCLILPSGGVALGRFCYYGASLSSLKSIYIYMYIFF